MKKVALITGASSGIGEETAKLLLREGYTVYGAARRLEKMKDIEAEGVHIISMDVANEQSMQDGVKLILEKEGQIDALVNNAGYGSYGALEDVPMSEARYQFEINVFGMARLTQLVLPAMRERRSGRIINVSSVAGKLGEPHGSWYHATKYAVEGLSDCLRMELKQFNIQVVIIEPGAIVTEWNKIAREHLQKVSGTTAYKDLALKQVKMMEKMDARGSKPIEVARYIVKGITARNPRTRYAAAGGAKAILLFKKMVSDRVFDKVVLGMINR